MFEKEEKPYKRMVRLAWKELRISPFDTRDFVTAVRELREDRDRLLEENDELIEMSRNVRN